MDSEESLICKLKRKSFEEVLAGYRPPKVTSFTILDKKFQLHILECGWNIGEFYNERHRRMVRDFGNIEMIKWEDLTK